MVQVVKEALDIGLDQVAIPSVLEVKGEVADRIPCPPSGAIAVREPVGLMLASIFQNHDAYFPSLVDATPENCRDLFLLHPKVMEDRRRYRTELMDYLNDWFDLELNGVAGIDVYAQPFPHQRGWAVYENRFTRALIYRLEDMQCIQAVLEEFLGVKLP